MLPAGELEALPHSPLSNLVSILPHLHSHDSQAPATAVAAWGCIQASRRHPQGWRPPTALNKEPVLWGRYVVQSQAKKWDLQ